MALKLGWIGAGVMGRSMAWHLIKEGHALTVFSRTALKAQNLLNQGAAWAASAREVAQQSDIVFTMVGFPDEVRDVYLGATGLLSGVREGSILIDMTTTSPSLTCEIDGQVRAKQAHFIDAPVSGGDVGARNASLSIMVGGEKGIFERVRPLLEILGKNIVYQGASGAGQHAKLSNQIVIASTMVGVCEALVYAFRAGLDPLVLLQSISKGAAGCWTLENLAPRMLRGDFAPGFLVDHFVKDMQIALEEATRMKLDLPGLKLACALYEKTQTMGHGRQGTQALLVALQALAQENG